MNTYDAGNVCIGAISRGTGTPYGVDVVMPSAMRDEILSIAGSFRRLDIVIQKAAVLPSEFKQAWSSFRDEFNAFAQRHENWRQNLWYKSYQKALEYRRALDDWRDQFEKLSGVRVPFPTPASESGPSMAAPDVSSLVSGASRFKKIAYIAGGIGVLWGVSKLLGSAVEAKREFIGPRALAAPAKLVKNPPAWAQDPELWESARVAVEPYADRYANPAAVTTHVYKQMGGRVGGA